MRLLQESEKLPYWEMKYSNDAIRATTQKKPLYWHFILYICADCDLYIFSFSSTLILCRHFIWLRWISLLGYLMRFQQRRRRINTDGMKFVCGFLILGLKFFFSHRSCRHHSSDVKIVWDLYTDIILNEWFSIKLALKI